MTFNFKMYTRTKQGQEFLTGQKNIDAVNYDNANKLFSKMDLPFHSFATVTATKL